MALVVMGFLANTAEFVKGLLAPKRADIGTEDAGVYGSPEFRRRAVLKPQVLDMVPYDPAVTLQDAADNVQRIKGRAIEAGYETHMLGGRTFPTATSVGGSTPMIRDAQSVGEEYRRRVSEQVSPFRTDLEGNVHPDSQWDAVNVDRIKPLPKKFFTDEAVLRKGQGETDWWETPWEKSLLGIGKK